MPNAKLNTFRILFLVYGILTLVFSLVFVMYAGMGLFFHEFIEAEAKGELPFNPGIIFIVAGSIGFIFAITLGILTILASNYIKALKNYQFVFVISILLCLTGILGILLGIFTLIEISKPEIKSLFNEKEINEE